MHVLIFASSAEGSLALGNLNMLQKCSNVTQGELKQKKIMIATTLLKL